MPVTTQIMFPYMSDAHAPAMDVQMTPQDAGMRACPDLFGRFLALSLMSDNGYSYFFALNKGSPRLAEAISSRLGRLVYTAGEV
jgi:hypothetical protein